MSKDYQPLSAQELQQGLFKWWTERADSINAGESIDATIGGIQQDITFIFRYLRSVTDLLTTDQETNSENQGGAKHD